MSRCFPFPPPGYVKKTDEVDLLKEEKQKEKKHKKDKRDKEKRESKEKREKEGRDGKHKEKKDKREKHREKKKDKDKDKSKDRDKSKISTANDKGFPRQAEGPNAGKLHQRKLSKMIRRVSCLRTESPNSMLVTMGRRQKRKIIWLRTRIQSSSWSWTGGLGMMMEELAINWFISLQMQTIEKMRGLLGCWLKVAAPGPGLMVMQNSRIRRLIEEEYRLRSEMHLFRIILDIFILELMEYPNFWRSILKGIWKQQLKVKKKLRKRKMKKKKRPRKRQNKERLRKRKMKEKKRLREKKMINRKIKGKIKRRRRKGTARTKTGIKTKKRRRKLRSIVNLKQQSKIN
ncbi:hypothetical protein E2542_SST17061 [Spatholobus suberectus]|nr:hypothetical protein E2542_SST17061 [Spatholobus suberectus]